MAFNNPIGTQTQVGASAPTPVQNTTVQSAVGGLTDIMNTISAFNEQQTRVQAAANQGPEAWQVKEEWETSGSQQAVDIAKRYKKWVEIEGRAKAEVRLNAETLNIQSSMGATEADKFRSTLGSLIGKNSDVDTREAEMARENARLAQLDTLEMTGRQFLAADGAKYGVDPSKVTRDQAIGIAMVTEGQKQSAALEAAQLGVINSRNTQIDRDRKLASQAAATYQSANITAGIRQSLASFSSALEQNPSNAEQAKAQFIADMELRKSRVVNDLASGIKAANGDVADVDQSIANGLISQYDTVIQLARGDMNVKQMQSTFDAISLGTTLDTVKKLDTPMQRHLLVTNTTRMPLELTEQAVKQSGGSYNPADYSEVIRNVSSLGAAGAVNKTSVPTEVAYSIPYQAAQYSLKDEGAKREAADSIVLSFKNSYEGSSAVRSAANSNKGLPVLIDKLAKDPEMIKLAPEIQAAAEKEGTTVEQMFMDSTKVMFRESVYPSLSLGDPYVLQNLDIQYSAGNFSVKLKADEYNKMVGVSNYQSARDGYNYGQQVANDKVASINKRLMRVQQLLNTQLQAYKNLGGNPDDLGEAMKYQLEVSAGITRLQGQ